MPAIIDWGSLGVFWTGQPGDEIARLDDMSDYGRSEPLLDGDMAAALVVARESDYRWIVYEDDGEHWTVTAFDDKDDALSTATDAESTATSFEGPDIRVYVFDGRTETMQDAPDGLGWMPPAGREWTVDTTTKED